MSIQFFEGFETVGTETGLANQATTRPRIDFRWDNTTSGVIKSSDSFFLIDDGFSEGYAINMGTNAGFSAQNRLEWHVPDALEQAPGASFTPWIIGARIHVPSESRTWTPFFIRGLFGGSSPTGVLGLEIENSSNINVNRDNPGAFEIANADGVLTPGAWHYIEFEFKIAESGDGGYVEVRLDGNEVIANTVADTNNALSTGFNVLYFQNATITTSNAEDYVGYDDMYILYTGTSPHTDYLTPVRVRSLPPDSDVLNAWDKEPNSGNNYEKVDENGADATDYVETDVTEDRDRYTVTDPTEDDEILALKVEAEAINPTGGTPSLHLEVVSGTSVESTEHTVSSTTAYDVFEMIVQDDPAGGAWTVTDINSLQVGYRFVNNMS